MIKIKIATGKTIAKESYEYDGPLTLAAVDGTSGADGPDSSTAKDFMERERSAEENKKSEDVQENNNCDDNGCVYSSGTIETPWGEAPCYTITKGRVETDPYEYGNNPGYDIDGKNSGSEREGFSIYSSGGDGDSGSSNNAPGQQTDFKDLFSSYLQNSSTAQFTTGLFAGGGTAIAPDGFLVTPFVGSLNYPQSFKMGYGLGQSTWGTLEMLGGFGGHLLGFAFDTTGFGALAGIPTHVLSNAVGIGGAADFGAGYQVFRSAVSNKNAGGSSETSGPKGAIRKGTYRYSQLINKLKRIKNVKGNKTITGKINHAEADFLGKKWVGDNYKVVTTKKGDVIYISKDGLRQYRSPSTKSSSYSQTGVQANFQSRDVSYGNWINNAHIDVD